MAAHVLPVACPHPTDQPLSDLAEVFDERFADLGPADPAHLLRVEPDPDGAGLTLGLLPLTIGEHPGDALLGFTAPPGWSAIGTTAIAQVIDVNDARRTRTPQRLTFLLERCGRCTTLLSPIGSPPTARSRLPGPPTGWLVDACARALERPTPPPATGPGGWIEAVWLDHMIALALLEPARRWVWGDAASLHPLAGSGRTPSPATLRRRTRHEHDRGWEAQRRSMAAGHGLPILPITAERAGWFDEGSFARFAQQLAGPMHEVLVDLAALLPTGVVNQVHEALVGPAAPAGEPVP
ncbi:MAG: hypothetical protein JWN46_3229 [Acidimicrobiales bacterium]|nr:hypothetical protein [Acidimicrobiales bacterium]